jgi:hypothetical protein
MTIVTSEEPASERYAAQVVLTLMYVDHCRNWPLAADRVHAAVKQVSDRRVCVEWRPIRHAGTPGFAGSPTFLVKGVDPFPGAAASDLCCRLYDTGNGIEGAPSVQQLVAALRGAMRA